MRRLLVIMLLSGIGVVACGGDDAPKVDRQAAIDLLMENTKGTVGSAHADCLRTFLLAQSDKDLQQMATGVSQALTDAVIHCVDG